MLNEEQQEIPKPRRKKAVASKKVTEETNAKSIEKTIVREEIESFLASTPVVKKKKVVTIDQTYTVSNAASTNVFANPVNNIILHLKISENVTEPDHLVTKMFVYDPELHEPSPYERQQCFLSSPYELEEYEEKYKHEEKKTSEPPLTMVSDHSETRNASYTMDASQSQKCWWCCHPFDNDKTKYSLPCRRTGKTFSVVGSFCSPECTVAFSSESGHRYGDLLKQYTWINFLYGGHKLSNDTHVALQAAPPRETLQIFGGPYTIEQFRARSKNYEINVEITMAPMIPIKGFTDEIVVEYKKSKTFVPMEKERMDRATSELRLKRKKTKKSENTLDDFMNLKVKNTVAT